MSEISGDPAGADHVVQVAQDAQPGQVESGQQQPWQSIRAFRLAAVRRIRAALPLLILLVVGVSVTGSGHTVPGLIVILTALALYGALWFASGRSARSWKFLERADDLLIYHGLLFRKQIVVPYGRMQFVDVKVGPLERMLGIATVQLHTASAASDARIPGLAPAQAQVLRDQLAELGQARMSGL
jgi:membrane protein YdbS with pleckstrin-like domain